MNNVFSEINISGLNPSNGGQNSSVSSLLDLLSCVMQRCGFNPPLVEGIFPLELTWVLTPLPKNSNGWVYKPRSSLCTHAFHHTGSKDPDIHVLDGWMPATKTHHPACTVCECDHLYGWITKTATYAKFSPKMVNPWDLAGNTKGRQTHMFAASVSSQWHGYPLSLSLSVVFDTALGNPHSEWLFLYTIFCPSLLQQTLSTLR